MRETNKMRKGLVGVKVWSLPHFGTVATDQVMQTAQKTGEAAVLSQLLALIWCKNGGIKKDL